MSLPRVCQALRYCGPISLLTALYCVPANGVPSDGGAQGVVRAFCEADGFGKRVTIQGWARIAPLVAWPLEPSWDHVVLINSYTVGWAQPIENTDRMVEVRYAVSADVSASGIQRVERIDSVVYRLQPSGTGGWLIVGPPPPPHLFEQRSEPEAIRQSLERGGVNFLPDSLFVWYMFRSAGWDIAFQRTADMLSGGVFREVKEPAIGDVVMYLHDGTPYHVGLLEAEGQIVSSTLNAGIMRTTIDAFAGEVTYLRLVEPAPPPPTAVTTPTREYVMGLTPTPRPKATPKPAVQKPAARRGRTTKPTVRRKAAPSKRVVGQHASPTPAPPPAALD